MVIYAEDSMDSKGNDGVDIDTVSIMVYGP